MTLEDVLKAVSKEYGITVDQIKGNSRKNRLAEARQMICYILRDHPIPEIAKVINRHRTSPHYCIEKMKGLLSVYPSVNEKHENILRSINPNDYMTIKLTNNQLEGIYILTRYMLDNYAPENIGESLLHEIVFKINEKIRAKLGRKQFDNKTGSNLTLTSIEAKAFYVWFNQNDGHIPEGTWSYELIVGTNVINQIDKVYA